MMCARDQPSLALSPTLSSEQGYLRVKQCCSILASKMVDIGKSRVTHYSSRFPQLTSLKRYGSCTDPRL